MLFESLAGTVVLIHACAKACDKFDYVLWLGSYF